MNNLKKYLRDLNIVKNNLRKFYYNSASEWLKPDIMECITSLSFEIARYTKKISEKEEYFNKNQCTIFDILNEVKI